MVRTLARVLLATALVSLGAMVSLACGSDDDDVATGDVGQGAAGTRNNFEKDDRLRVATTVAPITSIVLQVGGNRVYIHGIVPDGVDSHTFEPAPSDARLLARADMLIMNGAELEGNTEQVARANMKDPSKIYKLADNTLSGDDPTSGFLYDFSFPRAAGKPNPHLWMNPLYALKYADLTRQWLSENDPENATYYQENYDRFAAVIRQLDEAIRKDQESVPPQNRKLLTYHDSWAYWAREYGWTVIGAVQPSDFKEPSAREVAEIIRQIREEGVPAVFGSEEFPSATLEQIAREANVVFEDKLSDDAPPGELDDPNHTYVGMLVENMRIMFERLGGRADLVLKVPVEDTFQR